MATVLLVAALLIVAYWVAWLAHRSLVASETTPGYTQFEDAFPLADGWLALCLVAASYCLVTARRAALFWLLAGGGAGCISSRWTCSTTSNTGYGARVPTG